MKRKKLSKSQYMRRKRKTPVMKATQKVLYTSSLALSLFATGITAPNVFALDWTPRSVSEISQEIEDKGGKLTYTVKYGDTLSAIAEAMNIDLDILAQVNQIADVNLIFPDTVLTTTVDQNHQVTQIEIQAPVQEEAAENTVQATVDIAANEITVDDTVIPLESTDAPSSSASITEVSVETPVEEAPVTEVPVETPLEETPVEEVPVTEVLSSIVVVPPVELIVKFPVVVFIPPFAYKTPLYRPVPATSSLYPGAVVPTPTLVPLLYRLFLKLNVPEPDIVIFPDVCVYPVIPLNAPALTINPLIVFPVVGAVIPPVIFKIPLR